MTQNEIIEMARQAGWTGIYSQWISPTEIKRLTVPVTLEQLEAFVKLVAEREREECAKICETEWSYHEEERAGKEFAEAIRARQ